MSCASEYNRQPIAKTPNLDRLAERGTRFTRAYTPSPICVPARAAFATGRYVHQIRHWDNAMPYFGEPDSWGHILQRNGISVESIGKLHYRDEQDAAGFDKEHLPMMVQGGVGMVWGSIRDPELRVRNPGKSRMLGDYIGPGQSSYTDYDKAVTDRTCEWLQQHANAADKSEPWCLYVGLVAPHFPLVVPEEYFDLYPASSLPRPKLHSDDGFARHPWIEKLVEINDNDAQFVDQQERLTAISSYYGLCSWMDFNVGRILDALDECGLSDKTTVVYSSDHGDNVGARGLWGKSNLYEESAAIPLIMAGPLVAAGKVCDTPASLLDVSATVTDHFGLSFDGCVGESLYKLSDGEETDKQNRVVFSEYHAVGSVSGGFMIVKGNYKLIYYVGYQPELFDLQQDPEETVNRVGDTSYSAIYHDLLEALYAICDPEEVDRQAHDDQRALIDSVGGMEKALGIGPTGATPPPTT